MKYEGIPEQAIGWLESVASNRGTISRVLEDGLVELGYSREFWSEVDDALTVHEDRCYRQAAKANYLKLIVKDAVRVIRVGGVSQ